MYLPKHFEGDEAIGREIMQAHSWALLTTTAEDGAPLTTHLSLLWQEAGGPHGSLVGHVARANPHWKLFARPAESLALFWGPHAYVSSSWYATQPAVPTWDYAAVHIHGVLEAVDDAETLYGMLRQLSAHDATFDVDALDPAYRAGMVRGIRGFRLRSQRIEAQWKMSQNRSAADRQGVVAGLRAHNEHATADLIAATLP